MKHGLWFDEFPLDICQEHRPVYSAQLPFLSSIVVAKIDRARIWGLNAGTITIREKSKCHVRHPHLKSL